ncbi:Hypothetical_protein [Hexamita inflata]|uniref:Hypothetical_protein n=1 Tax=Hexamita inflata TaxID=28002 RepID=A0AA86QM71_9EUKA|nr:Hypothetical protein HINF_LOCUS48770 [Hexamita inflata]
MCFIYQFLKIDQTINISQNSARPNRLRKVKSPGSGSVKLLSKIGMAKGMPSTSLQDWKAATAPLLPQKRRWYDDKLVLHNLELRHPPSFTYRHPKCSDTDTFDFLQQRCLQLNYKKGCK